MRSKYRTNGQARARTNTRPRPTGPAVGQQEAVRFLLAELPAIVWATDAHLRLAYAAGGGLECLGLVSADAPGLTLGDFLGCDDPDYPPLAGHRRVLAGKAVTFEADWDGRCFACRVEPLWAADGGVRGCIGIAHDVTDRRRSEDFQAALAALARAQSDAHAPQDAASRLLQALCHGLDWDAGGLWLADSPPGLLRCQAQWHRPDLAGGDFAGVNRATVFGLGDELPGRVWSSGRPAWVPDVTRDRDFSRADAAASTGLHSGCFFPVVVDKQVLGVVELFAQDVRPRDDEWLELLTQLGGQVGLAVERLRLSAMLAERVRLAGLAADVGRALGAGATLRDMLRPCADAMLRHLNAACALIWTLNATEDLLELQASARNFTQPDGPNGRVPVGALRIGPITQERRPHLSNDVLNDPWVGDKDWVRREGLVSFAGYPLLVEGRVVGVAALFARHPLTQATILALGSVADQIALGIQRKRAEEARLRSEERFRSAFAHASVGMAVTDLEGRFMEVNPAFCSITGYAADELGNTDLLTITHPDDRDKLRVLLRRVLSGEMVSFVIERRYLRKDGDIVWVQASVSLVRDPEGKASQVVALVEDVTRRRRALEAVRISEARKTAILEHALHAIVTVDLDGRIVEFNPAAERTFGRRRADAIGQDLVELLVPAALREPYRQRLQDWLATGRGEAASRRQSFTALRADGTQFAAELTVTRIPLGEAPLFTFFLRELGPSLEYNGTDGMEAPQGCNGYAPIKPSEIACTDGRRGA
jgi:PAS domain S-box-containing protein